MEEVSQNFIQIETIFTKELVEEIWTATNPIHNVFEILESNYRANTGGKIDYDSNIFMAIAEFHVNNLIYLKENFNYPSLVNAKLLNLLAVLLNLREEKSTEREKIERRNPSLIPSMTNNEEGEIQKRITIVNLDSKEPDFVSICKKKLREIKNGLHSLNLVFNKENNKQQSASPEGNFFLKNNEIVQLLDYINTFYFPFIKLYYHFINIERITENKKIEVIINKPLPVPPLNVAVAQMQEKHQFEEQKDEKIEESKKVFNFLIFLGRI